MKQAFHHFLRGLVPWQHPFHMAYLATGTVYYAIDGVLVLAACSGVLLLVVLALYLEGSE